MTITTGQRVWVLVIEHRHGTDTSVFLTEQGATDGLTVYVDSWWGEEFPSDAAPGDDTERVREYFERMDNEGYVLTEATVLP